MVLKRASLGTLLTWPAESSPHAMMEPAFACVGTIAMMISKYSQRVGVKLIFGNEKADGRVEASKTPNQADKAEKRGCIELLICESRVD